MDPQHLHNHKQPPHRYHNNPIAITTSTTATATAISSGQALQPGDNHLDDFRDGEIKAGYGD